MEAITLSDGKQTFYPQFKSIVEVPATKKTRTEESVIGDRSNAPEPAEDRAVKRIRTGGPAAPVSEEQPNALEIPEAIWMEIAKVANSVPTLAASARWLRKHLYKPCMFPKKTWTGLVDLVRLEILQHRGHPIAHGYVNIRLGGHLGGKKEAETLANIKRIRHLDLSGVAYLTKNSRFWSHLKTLNAITLALPAHRNESGILLDFERIGTSFPTLLVLDLPFLFQTFNRDPSWYYQHLKSQMLTRQKWVISQMPNLRRIISSASDTTSKTRFKTPFDMEGFSAFVQEVPSLHSVQLRGYDITDSELEQLLVTSRRKSVRREAEGLFYFFPVT